jgi:hypothetical protein
MKFLTLILGCFFVTAGYAQDEKVIYQYRKYERFDLGNMEVKGNLIAPGDISVRERERKRFQVELYTRKEFDPFIKKDIESLR